MPCGVIGRMPLPRHRSVQAASYVKGGKAHTEVYAGAHRFVRVLIVFIAVSVMCDALCGTFIVSMT